MTTSNFFEMMEKTNEFKTFIGETIKTKANIIYDNETIGTAYTFDQFIKVLETEFHCDLKEAISDVEVQKTSSMREFNIICNFDGEKSKIKLFVD